MQYHIDEIEQIPSITNINLDDKMVLIRQDLNVPIKDGVIKNDARLKASLPTIKYALEHAKKVIICSHLGRPDPNNPRAQDSLLPVADYLSSQLNIGVFFCKNYLDDAILDDEKFNSAKLILLENVRLNAGESENDADLAQRYANLANVFVMDAFGSAHRAHSSTFGVVQKITTACAGILLTDELRALSAALKSPKKPMLAIVGGSKVSTKLDVLTHLAKICDTIIVGGGIANTFLAAKGVDVGASLCECDLIDTAKKIMLQTHVLLPKSVVVAKKNDIDFNDFINSLSKASFRTCLVSDVAKDEMILDIDQNHAQPIVDAVLEAKTILWNGPLGVFEAKNFSGGTKILADAVAKSEGFSIAGGGDTLAAVHQFSVADDIDYLCTGGGAFLEFVEGKSLPAIFALIQKTHA